MHSRLPYSIVTFMLSVASVALAQSDSPRATITDVSGVKSELTGVAFTSERMTRDYSPKKFRFQPGAIAVATKAFDVAVPLENLKSIEVTKDTVLVTYFWLGEEKTVTGKLEQGKFTGKGEFGDFTIESGQIKSLHIPEPKRDISAELRKSISEQKTTVEATLLGGVTQEHL